MDDTLHDSALSDLRDHEAQLRIMIDQHKSGARYIATSCDGKPTGRSDEDLQHLKERAAAARADIEEMQKNR